MKTAINFVFIVLALLILGAVSLPGNAVAATVTNLTVEDISTGSSVVVYAGDFTIVEWDGFEDGGTAGNTVRTSTTTHFSHLVQENDPLFYRRLNQGIPAGWTGTKQRFRGESSGWTSGTSPVDFSSTAQATTTISGLDASKTYEFFYIAGGRVTDEFSYLADFGAGLPTTFRASDLDLYHIDGLGDDPLNSPNDLGFYAVPLGQNSGASSYTMSLASRDRLYWIGFGFVEVTPIPEPTTLVLAAVCGLLGVGLLWRRRRHAVALA